MAQPKKTRASKVVPPAKMIAYVDDKKAALLSLLPVINPCQSQENEISNRDKILESLKRLIKKQIADINHYREQNQELYYSIEAVREELSEVRKTLQTVNLLKSQYSSESNQRLVELERIKSKWFYKLFNW